MLHRLVCNDLTHFKLFSRFIRKLLTFPNMNVMARFNTSSLSVCDRLSTRKRAWIHRISRQNPTVAVPLVAGLPGTD